MRVLFCPDKFAGTLTASQAATAMARGWRTVRPLDEIVVVPIADGGEGTVATLAAALPSSQWLHVEVADQANAERRVTAGLLTLPDGRMVVEAAQACGISSLPPADRRPASLTSRGVGEMIVATPPDSSIIVALGGTSTVDGGAGALEALGHELLDSDGVPIGPGLDGLASLASVRRRSAPQTRAITLASDVSAPLTGARGAAMAFGPQKGLDQGQCNHADRLLGRFHELASQSEVHRLSPDAPGAGAAGGLGYALQSFEDATFAKGAELVAALVGLPDRILAADLVITGEGRVDSTSGEGKAPFHAVTLARSADTPVGVIAGSVGPEQRHVFDLVGELGPEGFDAPERLVALRAAEMARSLS